MSTNRIIVPPNFDVIIEVKYDTRTGYSVCELKKGSTVVNMLMMAGIFLEHASGLVKKVLTYKLEPVNPTNSGSEIKPEGNGNA